MITKNRIREILWEGRQVDDTEYIEHCVLNNVKTFYFFCERLSKEPANVALSSTELNNYIIAQLDERGDYPGVYFNPHGWFGKAWTEWRGSSKAETEFKNEYCDVLIRTRRNPYWYEIRPEYLNDVVEIFAEFTSSAR